jgi:hypothetical protein
MSEMHAAASSRGAAGPDQTAKLVRLRTSSFGAVAMLIIQFILGIIYNLYGTAPTSTKSVGLFSSPDLALHVIVGILLVIAGIGQLIRAVGTRHRLAISMSAVGLLAILAAFGAGLGFSSSGTAGASLGMSLAFAVALACYVVLIFALPSSGASSSTPTTLCSSRGSAARRRVA